MPQLERLLPFLAHWGVWTFGFIALAAIAGPARLGRGRLLWIPATWPARIGSTLLLAATTIAALCLLVVLGPLRPVLSQVRQIGSPVDRPAAEIAFR